MQLINGRAFIEGATSIRPHETSVTIVDEDGMSISIDLLTIVRAIDVVKVDCALKGTDFDVLVASLQQQAAANRADHFVG